VWQIWTYRKTHKEQIKGRLSITAVPIEPGKNVPALQLEIWNDGHIPVYIKSVALIWGNEGPDLGSAVYAVLFKEYPPKNDPLQPGDGANFVLPVMIPHISQLISDANKQPENKVWISVQSPRGEPLRIAGKEVKHLLSSIVNEPPK
jgi:hypothetical protein